jgi:hypothetical protein
MRYGGYGPFFLAKVSGDFVESEEVNDEIAEFSKEYNIILFHGAGKQFTEALKKAGMEYHFDEDGNRVLSQEALRLCYEGPQKEIEEYYRSIFGNYIGRSIILIPPISQENGELVNTNADTMFRVCYESGLSRKGIIYTKNNRDKTHLQFKGVEIRYL